LKRQQPMTNKSKKVRERDRQYVENEQRKNKRQTSLRLSLCWSTRSCFSTLPMVSWLWPSP
jgi:hypothetical protein